MNLQNFHNITIEEGYFDFPIMVLEFEVNPLFNIFIIFSRFDMKVICDNYALILR